jgi:hypothetical protein
MTEPSPLAPYLLPYSTDCVYMRPVGSVLEIIIPASLGLPKAESSPPTTGQSVLISTASTLFCLYRLQYFISKNYIYNTRAVKGILCILDVKNFFSF